MTVRRSRVFGGRRFVAGVAGVALALAAPSAAGEPRRLAVLELADAAGLDDAAVGYLAERVRGEAARLPRGDWWVMTRENLLELLPPGLDPADCEGECEVETGRNIGADVVVSGEIVRLGAELKVTLKAHETAGGALLGQEVASAPDVEALDREVVAAARRLLDGLRGSDGSRGRAVLRLRAPEGLEVHLNGVLVGRTPIPAQHLAPGRHRVALESRCHQRLEVPVELAARESRTLDLAPAPRLARLRVDAHTPDGEAVTAQVRVDGRRIGETPGAFEVPVCAERIEVRGSGASWRGTLDLRPDEVTGVTATLGGRRTPAGAARGRAEADASTRTAAWLAVGGGIAVGLGGLFALQNQADGRALQKDPGNQKLRDEVDASYRASLALYVGGGIAAAAGIVWWLTASDDAPRSTAGVGVGIAPGAVTIGGAW